MILALILKIQLLLDEAFTHASYVNEHPREKLKILRKDRIF